VTQPAVYNHSGRRAPDPAHAERSIRLSAVLRSAPDYPASVDYLSVFSGWQMLGNDTAGVCVPVTWANERREVTGSLTGTESYPTLDMVYEAYRTQNPDFDPNGSQFDNGPGSPADAGMDIQTFLEYLVKSGGPDGVKAVGFAKVDQSNLDEVKAAIAVFGYVWTGINVQQANMQQFACGQPWDYVQGSADDGGHSVLSGGYQGQAGSDVRFITWATETSFTDEFWTKQVEEAWVVIWPEHLGSKEFVSGMDLTAFAAAYTQITGRPFPAVLPPEPAPAPEPSPQPAPGPSPEPAPAPAPPSLVPPPTVDSTVAVRDHTVVLSGTGELGHNIIVYAEDHLFGHPVDVNSLGKWLCSGSLPDGHHKLEVIQRSSDGGASASVEVPVTVGPVSPPDPPQPTPDPPVPPAPKPVPAPPDLVEKARVWIAANAAFMAALEDWIDAQEGTSVD